MKKNEKAPHYRLGSCIHNIDCHGCPYYSQTQRQWRFKIGHCSRYGLVDEYGMCDDHPKYEEEDDT